MDTLQPEMQEILFWKEVAERIDNMTKVIDKLKGRELSGISWRNWPSEWQKISTMSYPFQNGIIMAKLEYGELGFCPILVSSIKMSGSSWYIWL